MSTTDEPSKDKPTSEGDDETSEATSTTPKRKLQEKPISELTAEELAEAELNEFELDPEKRREVRKMRRVMANRRSARESRERRKKLLTDLQQSVESLTADNANLSKENVALRRELAALIEQSGGAASLSMIPNIQTLLEGTPGLSGLNFSGTSPPPPPPPPMGGGLDGKK